MLPGSSAKKTAGLWVRLVREVLGLDRFVTAGGDWGAVISIMMGHLHPDDLRGVYVTLPNFAPALRNQFEGFELDDLEPDEREWFEREWRQGARPGRPIVRTDRNLFAPQTDTYAGTDSPLALAVDIVDGRRRYGETNGDVESVFTREELVTNVMLYWVTDTWGSARRFYWYTARDPGRARAGTHVRWCRSRPVWACSRARCSTSRRGSSSATPTSCTGARSRQAATSPPASSRSCSSTDLRALRPQGPVLTADIGGRDDAAASAWFPGCCGGGDLAADAAAAARRGRRRHERRAQRGAAPRSGRGASPVLDDAGLAVSSVLSIGPAVPCGATGPIDADLEMLDAAAELGARRGASRRPVRCGDHSSREADARCRAWLERLAPRAVDLDVVVMLEPMFPMIRAPLLRAHVVARARARRRSRRRDRGRRHRSPLVGSATRRALRSARRRHRHRAAHQHLERQRSTSCAIRARRSPTGRSPSASSSRRSTPRATAGWYENEVLDEGTGGPRAVRPRLAGVVRRDLELKDQPCAST